MKILNQIQNFKKIQDSFIIKKGNNTKRPISIENLAKLIIISADYGLATTGENDRVEYENFTAETNTSLDLEDRISGLKNALGRTFRNEYENNNLNKKISDWTRHLSSYTDNKDLLQKATDYLNIDVELCHDSFNNALTKLNTNSEEIEIIKEDSTMQTYKPNSFNKTLLISNESFRDIIYESTNDTIDLFTLDLLDELFPNFVLTTGVASLNATYEDGDYSTDFAISCFLTSIKTNSDTVVALIKDFNREIDDYETTLQQIPANEIAAYLNKLFIEKEFIYLDYEQVAVMMNFISSIKN